MLHATALVLFESTDAPSILAEAVNQGWVAVVNSIDGGLYGELARRYYLALYDLRRRPRRAALPGQRQVEAEGRQAALQGVLIAMNERKSSEKAPAGRDEPAIFVEVRPDPENDELPEALRDFSRPPPPLSNVLGGPGRPPTDALCMMRAFLASPLLGVGDSPTAVHRQLRSNPTFARACGFLGPAALKQPGDLTSRRLPSLSMCEEFSEVMTRYGLWQLARIEQVRENIATGVVEVEDTVSFDTTHIEANSHCANVVPLDAKPAADGKKPKQRKVPRVRKSCDCGKENWEDCEHPWGPTDQGAAIVFKGPTRVYWAHKASVAAFADSEIPFDVRSLQYAAEHDGNTIEPHLELLQRDLPETIAELRHALADDAYQGNHDAVARFGRQARLNVPVHPNGRSKAKVAARFNGIDRFTPIGVPICDADHRFVMRGRDLSNESYIWAAPDDDAGQSVCATCPFAASCLAKGNRRHIRVDRHDFPQIDWDHPQHFAKNNARYQKRTGIERAIKRLKTDLLGEQLGHRDGPRVQAHLDRKLLTFHLLLAAADSG